MALVPISVSRLLFAAFCLTIIHASTQTETNVEREASDSLYNVIVLRGSNASAVQLKNHLAVIPGKWESAGMVSSLYDVESSDATFTDLTAHVRASDFLVWDQSFLSLLGEDAKVERIQSFPVEEQDVHEAPVFVPETSEVVYSDTSAVGWLWAINVNTYETRKVYTEPPLYNVNGGTYHRGSVYLTTNGGEVRGLYRLNMTTGEAEVILNNYRGRRLNSPNDLIFDSKSNILFTDPPYGWFKWPGVQAPELPRGIYHFNTETGALTSMFNSIVQMPNGLALSPDESTLYVADSSSSPTSGGDLTSQRNVWAFDIKASILTNPRLIYQAESGWPDGLRVTENGYLMAAVAGGVDVVDPTTGLLLGKISTPDDVIYNLEAVQTTSGNAWMLTGQKHVYKVRMLEKGAAKASEARLSEMALGGQEIVRSYWEQLQLRLRG